MKTVALISGGKDSCYNMLQCIAAGHEIVALANLHPPRDHLSDVQLDEMDSYMYQTVGHDAISLYSEATGLPLYREAIHGTSLQQDADYTLDSQEDEVEDLYRLLARVKKAEEIEAVSVGAILSNYQRVRVENVCNRLGLTSLSYLWQRNQGELLEEMISNDMNAVLIKVAALGLDPKKHLGKSIQACHHELMELEKKFGLNVCGEGGEYETLTLDCPIFKKKIVIDEMEVISHSKDPFAPVAYLKFPKLSLVDKETDSRNGSDKIKKPKDFCQNELMSNPNEFPTSFSSSEENRNARKRVDVLSFSGNSTQTQRMIFIGGLIAESEADLTSVMDTLCGKIENHGSTMNNLLSVCMYIRDMADYPRINKVYSQYFGLNPPVRVCVQAPITCYAMIESVAARFDDDKRTLHVQSVSHWAPANIGPYSQCVQIGDLLLVSGQIGLIPGSMTLPQPANFVAECRLALRHVTRVLGAMDKDISLNNALQVICFLREKNHIDVAKVIWKEYGGDNGQKIAFVVTNNLPRNALVEWQVWAHRPEGSIKRFTTTVSASKKLGSMHVTKCGDVTALMCELDNLPVDKDDWNTFHQIITQNLGENHTIKIFYKIDNSSYCWKGLRDIIPDTIAITMVPVCELESVALICGVHC